MTRKKPTAAADKKVGTRRRATDEEIAAALDGPAVSCREVARRLRCGRGRVARVRAREGMDTYRRGRRPAAASWEEAFNIRAVPVDGGHLRWPGRADGGPLVNLGAERRSAYRVSFTAHHGREPHGPVLPTCDNPRCVAGEHLADAWMRALREAMP